MSSYFDNFDIKYAVKANPNPRILSILKSEGLGIDASSDMEVRLALDAGFKPDQILFTPNYASKKELLWASGTGVPINFDSIGQLRLVDGKVPHTISFRIKIDYGRGEFKGTTTSGHDAKFGITEAEAISAYKIASEMGAKEFGIHVMAGSNVLDPNHTGRVASAILEVVKKISRSDGIEFKFIDMGGGLGVPYQPEIPELDLKAAFGKAHDAFKKSFEGRMPAFCIEPGRYLVADSSVLLGSVTDVKVQDKAYLGSNISMNTLLRPALYGAKHHIVLANRLNDEIKGRYEVVGQVCENTDRIGTDVELPDPRIDDILAVFNAGAYVSSMASNYNGRPIPAEVLITDIGEEVIRKSSTFADYIRNYV
ncbi:diaminopimelate decarboxylase [mine drainage metagenome]|uniref:Diaminopimelate decarboxylase n=2 Tax=mine drainage metagenome TaxID=410659 RepID=T0YRR6_9ZZZZ